MKNLTRIAIASLISLLGIYLSYTVLKPNSSNKAYTSKLKPMAKIAFSINDVKKQGTDKIIWEPVRKGDLLYLGDKIKTSSISNSKIEFLENGATIDVEPESLIVITQNNKKLTLQVMEGSLFVSSKNDVEDIALISGNANEKEVSLKNGDYSYSVNKDGKSNIEVIKSITENNSENVSKFTNIKPNYGATIFIDAKTNEEIVFNFRPVSENYNIKIEIGNSRNNLVEIKDAVIDPINGNIKIKPIIGTFYWRLTAIDRTQQISEFSSSIFKVNYRQKIPPTPIYPLNNDIIQLKNETEPLEFKWSLAHSFESVEVEIKRLEDKNANQILENVSNQTFLSTTKLSKPGRYSWKIIGKLEGNSTKLSTPEQFFNIIFGEELQSPISSSPEDKSIIYGQNKNESFVTNLHLTWKQVTGAKEYIVTIKNKDDQKREFKVSTNEFNIPKLNIGNYTWYVQSINEKNEVSKKINVRSFTVSQLRDIKFNNFSPNIFYTNSFPLFKFLWTRIDDAATYQLKVSQSQSMSPNEILKTKDNFFNYQIGKEGIYYVIVDALTSDGITIASSEINTFTVTKPPLPSTPIFLNAAKNWESNLNGDMVIETSNFNPKYQLIVELFDSKGSLIDQARTNTNIATFKALNPGNYYVTAKHIDEFNQVSEPSLKKTIQVPEKSAISPPKIKGIKVR